MSYSDWKIVLDLPAKEPKLGFDRYAQALVDIIRESEPRFAIGIFGGWGSGKSTLMAVNGRYWPLSTNDAVQP